MKTYDQCDAAEAGNYSEAYITSTQVANGAAGKFKVLADNALDDRLRSESMANYYEALRQGHLLIMQYTDFLNNQVTIAPPTDAVVDNMKVDAQKLASLVASDLNKIAILTIFAGTLKTYNSFAAGATA